MANQLNVDWIRHGGWRDEIVCRPEISARIAPFDLSGADLSGADLRGADLSKGDLHGVDLSGADLRPFRERFTRMVKANLKGALLVGALMHQVDLRSADLENADLRGADLTGAKLGGSNLAGVTYDGTTIWPKGFHPGLLVTKKLVVALDADTPEIATGASASDPAGQAQFSQSHLAQPKSELQSLYDTISKRIAALDTDFNVELDSERRLALQERRRRAVAEREEVANRLQEIERQLAGVSPTSGT